MLDTFLVTSTDAATSLRRGSAWHTRHSLLCREKSSTSSTCLFFFEYVALILGEGFSSFGFVDFSGTKRPFHPKMGIPHSEPCTCCTEGRGVVGGKGEWSGQGGVLLAATLCPLVSFEFLSSDWQWEDTACLGSWAFFYSKTTLRVQCSYSALSLWLPWHILTHIFHLVASPQHWADHLPTHTLCRYSASERLWHFVTLKACMAACFPQWSACVSASFLVGVDTLAPSGVDTMTRVSACGEW